MVSYKCADCNYVTEDKSNFKKHTFTKKHEKYMMLRAAENNIEGFIEEKKKSGYMICERCKTYITNKSYNMMRHNAVCTGIN